MLMVPLGIEHIWETVNQSAEMDMHTLEEWGIAIFEAPRSATTVQDSSDWI